MSSFRLALRHLVKMPGFTAVVVLTLALCIGANSAIFSIVNAVLLRPFPFPQSDRLVYVNNSYPRNDVPVARVSIPDFLDRIERAPSIESAMLYDWQSMNLTAEGQPRRVAGIRATPSLFATLGTAPALGRAFAAADAEHGAERVVVISDSLWKETYGARADIIGDSIRLNGVAHTVIGVMPKGFYFPEVGVKLWIPYAFAPEQRSDTERGTEYSWMLARLKPGATPEQLHQECDAIIAQNLERLPELRERADRSGFTTRIESLLDTWVSEVRPMLWLIQAGVLAALLIGCANVANLLLTRAISRERELSIRAALGAPRWQLVRQLPTESLMLFLAGGLVGLLVAMWTLDSINALGLADLPRGEGVRIDRSVFIFTLATAGLTGLAFGLLPAWRGSSVQAGSVLNEGSTRATASRRQLRLRHGLVVLEIALSVMLVTTAGLLARSFAQLQEQDPGFDPTSVLSARVSLPATKYPDDAHREAFAQSILRAMKALPGVEATGFTDVVPFGYQNAQASYTIAGRDIPSGQPSPHGQVRSVSADYFATMRIPLLRGRTFTEQDAGDSEQVVVIDRVLADRYWPGVDPIGQFIYRGDKLPQNLRRIVGVVGTVKQFGLDDPTTKETLYFPYAQRPVESFTLVLRTSMPPVPLIKPMRAALQALDPEQPLFDVQTLTGRIGGKLQRQRTPLYLIGAFGLLALVLAALGVYGVLAFSVGQRTQEFGIRAALGATVGDVVGLVIRQGFRLVAVGVILGLAGYLAVHHLLNHLVFGITTLDPIAVATGPAVLLAVAFAACLLPARRAARIDPLVALRSD